MTQQFQPIATIKVRVQPRASKNEILGHSGYTLRVRVTAPPEGGRANEAVIALLADALGVAKSRVNIVRGIASREKLVLIESLTQEEIQRRLSVWWANL
jgi:uncharacterized protein (TIGR00251 family)